MRRIRSRKLRTTWNVLKVASLLAIAGGLGITAAVFYNVSRMLPTKQDLDTWVPSEATRIYSSDDKLLARIYSDENRESIPITDMPKHLQTATIAIEDSRFYTHAGLDLKGIARALFENMRGGRWAQGGSTITQQLARNAYPEEVGSRKTMSRKLKELLLAREIERRLSKEEILQNYLNTVYYGSGAYGVKAAARTYFGKKPSQLSLAEAALLAGLPQRPSRYSPHEDRQAGLNRRDVVLNRMAELGYITAAEAQEAKSGKFTLVEEHVGRSRTRKAPHFVDYVVGQLKRKWGDELVYRGGLRVYTTLNLDMQESAERALRKQVARARASGKKVSRGAMVAVDPHTGHIKVMVGGTADYFSFENDGQLNHAVQARRQPGSAFKLFVYTAAIDSGYRADDTVLDAPVSFPDGTGKLWSPRNYDGRYRGRVTLRDAVAQSMNTPAVRMAHTVGIDKVIAYAHRMGIKSPLGRNLSLALGSSEVTPLELCSAYGTIPARGMHAEPMAITRVVGRDDRVIEDNRPRVTQAIPPETADTMAGILRRVVTHGTGRKAGAIEGAGGKTGTTSEDCDAWFVGFTPDLVAAVWVGNKLRTPMGGGVFGGTVCAPAWVELMQTALPIIASARQKGGSVAVARAEPDERRHSSEAERHRIREELRRNTVMADICIDSGLLAAPACPRKNRMGFPRGEEPKERCPLHSTYTEPSGGEPLESPGPEEAQPPAGSPVSASPAVEAAPGTGAPPAAAPRERTQEVTICISSRKRANEYCPEVEIRRMRDTQIPGTCSAHGPAATEHGAQ